MAAPVNSLYVINLTHLWSVDLKSRSLYVNLRPDHPGRSVSSLWLWSFCVTFLLPNMGVCPCGGGGGEGGAPGGLSVGTDDPGRRSGSRRRVKTDPDRQRLLYSRENVRPKDQRLRRGRSPSALLVSPRVSFTPPWGGLNCSLKEGGAFMVLSKHLRHINAEGTSPQKQTLNPPLVFRFK